MHFIVVYKLHSYYVYSKIYQWAREKEFFVYQLRISVCIKVICGRA
jgi:hypothetical protein